MPPPPDLDVLLVQMQYPGMAKPESDVFRDFLRARGRNYDRFEFNVHIGEGSNPPPDVTGVYRNLAVQGTQKRIDVVAYIDGFATLIEVKIRVGLGAQGQLLGYRTLWQLPRPDAAPPALLAIGRRADNDVVAALHANDIDIILYEEERP